MSKGYTTFEQSNKLKEIGIDVNSCDMYYSFDYLLDEYVEDAEIIPRSENGEHFSLFPDDIPCWSLSALMDILPSEFLEVGENSATTYKVNIRKHNFAENLDLYQIGYGCYTWHEDKGCTWSDMISSSEKRNLVDVVVEMLVWLKEHEKIR
jgi:hypothetical protein